MLIDCDTCCMREIACEDCVITVLLGAPDVSHDVSPAEAAAFGALAAVGLVPPLRLVPIREGSDPRWRGQARPRRAESADGRRLPPAASGP